MKPDTFSCPVCQKSLTSADVEKGGAARNLLVISADEDFDLKNVRGQQVTSAVCGNCGYVMFFDRPKA